MPSGNHISEHRCMIAIDSSIYVLCVFSFDRRYSEHLARYNRINASREYLTNMKLTAERGGKYKAQLVMFQYMSYLINRK